MKTKISSKLRLTALLLSLTFLYELIFPTVAWALTGGPSQPEVQSFEPVGTTDMVDLFSGDFNYNIPLLDVEGYPINISYHSGIGTDQEASWVGLGWNINPGAINRNMRGLPDDFNGEDIVNQVNKSKQSNSWGLSTEFQFELYSKETNDLGLGVSMGVKYNNYRGMGLTFGLSPSLTHTKEIEGSRTQETMTDEKKGVFQKLYKTAESVYYKNKAKETTGSLSFSFDSQDGMSLDANFSKSNITEFKDDCSLQRFDKSPQSSKSAGLGFNSRTGFKGLTLSATNKESGLSGSFSFLSNNYPSYTPNAKQSTWHLGFNGLLKLGIKAPGPFASIPLNYHFSFQGNRHEDKNLKAYGAMYYHEVMKQSRYRNSIDDFIGDFNRHNESTINKYTKDLPYSTMEYDYFSASGQGIGGSFRLKNSYIPVSYDDDHYNSSTDIGIGANLGVPLYLKWGVDLKPTYSSKRTGTKAFTKTEKKLFLEGAVESDNGLLEPAYFKNLGEKNGVDMEYYSKIGAQKAENIYQFGDRGKNVTIDPLATK